MTTQNPTRLIENWLPINEISVEAPRESGAMAGHPPVNQLHVWWARRPLVVSRATVAAALLSANADHSRFIRAIGSTDTVVAERRKMDEIKASGQWSNVTFSNKRAFTHNLTNSEREWFQDNLATPDPVVLDVTAGGGSIPFEAGRLGVPAIANELNPVATLILRATCQWPQQFGRELVTEYETVSNRLLERARALIADNQVYPTEPENDAADPDSKNFANQTTVRLNKYDQTYLFSRTVQCPSCGNLIPLSPNWRLDGKGKGIGLLPDETRGVCDFEIVDTKEAQSHGTVIPRSGQAECPYPSCGIATKRNGNIEPSYIASEAQAGRLGRQAYCVVVKRQWQKLVNGRWQKIKTPKGEKPREFRPVRPEDNNEEHIRRLLDASMPVWEQAGSIPNEAIPEVGDKVVTPRQYGMTRWLDMFTPRQQLAHGYCTQAFRELVDTDADAGQLTDIRRAAWCYAALGIDKLIARNNLLSPWDAGTNKIAGIFSSHDFGMKWSYAEMATAVAGLGLEWSLDEIGDCIVKLVEMAGHGEDPSGALVTGSKDELPPATPATVINGDAAMLDYDDDSVDAIVFDPPYHNNVNYAELSDFYYVWLKRTAGRALAEGLFAAPFTDKANEAIASPARFREQAQAANRGRKGKARTSAKELATQDYQRKMAGIFQECHRVIKKPDGVMVIMFTHKSNDAWGAMTVALAEAGFNITRTWPVKTEGETVNNRQRAAARSTILLVCRPAGQRRPKPWREVTQDIANAVRADLENLQGYGLSPVDTYLAAYGPALQVVTENWGTVSTIANPDRPDDPFGVHPVDALEVARKEVVAFRAEQIANGRGKSLSDPLTWFYILAQDGASGIAQDESGNIRLDFDEANLFARVIDVELDSAAARRVLAVKSGKVTLKSATERWRERAIAKERPAATPLDQVHTAMAIAAQENAAAAKEWLEFNGYRWEDGEFKTAFDALRKIRKPGHPDEAGARALQALLYEAEQPRQEELIGSVTIDE